MDGAEEGGIRILRREMLVKEHYRLERIFFEQSGKGGERQELRREVYYNGPGAAVLPLDPSRRTVLLVRQLRIPALVNGDGPKLIETCAGIVEEGDSPAETVRKEAEQEMGYLLHDICQAFALYTSPGASAEKLYFFTARYGAEDRVGEGGGLEGEGESIEVLELPLDEAWRMVEDGEIIDAKTVLLLQHLRLAG